jgi:hypothetical protein
MRAKKKKEAGIGFNDEHREPVRDFSRKGGKTNEQLF